MSLNEEDRITIVRYRIERAENAFLQAKANFKMGFVEVTANRLYYAAYYLSICAVRQKMSISANEIMNTR